MEKEQLESLIIDYIDNKLNSVDKQRVEKELLSNPSAFKMYEELKELLKLMDRTARLEPADKIKMNFHAMLEEEIAAEKKSRSIFLTPNFYRVAAAVALLILGGGLGYYLNQRNEQRLAMVEQKMKEQQKELEITREMLAKLGNSESASQRMQGIKVVYRMERTSDEIVDALLKTMNEDPSSNVRLAALEALSHFINEDEVRKGLINSLSRQKDPLVQITLIQLLVKMKEKGVVKDLEKLVNDEGTLQAVKDEAYSGLMKLS